MQANTSDQHISIRFPVAAGESTVLIRVKDDFGLALSSELPALGSASRGLRVLSETWNSTKTQLTLDVSGLAGGKYELNVWNPGQISTVEGADLKQGKLEIKMPATPAGSYLTQKMVLHFGRP